MSILGVVLNTLKWVFSMLGFIGIISLYFCIPASIIVFILALREQDEVKKKKKKKIAFWLFVGPILTILASLLFSALLGAVTFSGNV